MCLPAGPLERQMQLLVETAGVRILRTEAEIDRGGISAGRERIPGTGGNLLAQECHSEGLGIFGQHLLGRFRQSARVGMLGPKPSLLGQIGPRESLPRMFVWKSPVLTPPSAAATPAGAGKAPVRIREPVC